MTTLEEAIEKFSGSCGFYTNRKDTCEQLAKWFQELQRARVLLKATHDLLKAANGDVLTILVHYDEADCDGYCLMDDIEKYFDEFDPERRTDE